MAKEIRFKLISINLWQDIQALFANLPLVLISMLCFTIYGTVDAIWASRLGPSNLSYLGYGQRLVISIGNIVILGPWLILTPYLAEYASLGEHIQFQNMLAKSLQTQANLQADLGNYEWANQLQEQADKVIVMNYHLRKQIK